MLYFIGRRIYGIDGTNLYKILTIPITVNMKTAIVLLLGLACASANMNFVSRMFKGKRQHDPKVKLTMNFELKTMTFFSLPYSSTTDIMAEEKNAHSSLMPRRT